MTRYSVFQYPVTALFAVALTILVAAAPQRAAADDALHDALLLPELFEIMAIEGQENAGAIERDLLDSDGGAQWRDEISRAYDADRLLAQFTSTLDAELASFPEVRADALEFATSDVGRRVMRLEIDARSALLDPGVDDMAHEILGDMRASGAPRLDMVRERIDINDLVELNVALGLNTSMQYFNGLLSEAPPGAAGPMSSLLADVWEQETAIRAETVDWIEAYFIMAYQPLSDDELRAYIDFSGSESGQKLNTAMFQAFDQVFTEVSFRLGSAAGRALQRQDL